MKYRIQKWSKREITFYYPQYKKWWWINWRDPWISCKTIEKAKQEIDKWKTEGVPNIITYIDL